MGCPKFTYRTSESTSLKVVYRAKNLAQRFNVVDPLAHVEPGWSPYRAFYDNPIRYTDPTGMLETDYYDSETGAHLEHVEDGIDEAVAISKSSYESMKGDGHLTNSFSKTVGGVSLGSNTNFEKISATLYGEAGYINPNSSESAAIYDVLENRANHKSKTAMQIIEGGGIYGYGSTDYNIALAKGVGYDKEKYSLSRHNAARKGAMLGIANSNSVLDFSNGAYFWDASIYLDSPSSYKSNFFNKVGHGTFKGTNSKKITFSYTIKLGVTQFMKYNPSVYPKKTWP